MSSEGRWRRWWGSWLRRGKLFPSPRGPGGGGGGCGGGLSNRCAAESNEEPPHPNPLPLSTGGEGTRLGPIVIAEPADNIGGGAPGDGTGLFRALLKFNVR